MAEPSFVFRIYDFVTAVLSNWIAWVTGVPFALEQAVGFLPESIQQKIEAWVPRHQWKPILMWLCVAGFFVASFQAYDNVNRRLRIADDAQATYARLTAHRWEPLTVEEKGALVSELRLMPVRYVQIGCSFSDCEDLAYSFKNLFQSQLKWKVGVSGAFDSDEPLSIFSADAQARSNDINIATHGRLLFIPHETFADVPLTDKIDLVIGRKP